MTDRRRLTRRAAIGLIGTGVAISALETSGFSTVETGRGVSVATADTDQEGFLGFVDRGNGNLEFTNNTATSMTVTVGSPDSSVTLSGGGQEGNPITFGLAVGETEAVTVEGGDTPTITVEGDLGAKGVIRFERTVSAASPIGNVDGSASTAGASGKFGFELRNSGDTAVTITKIGVLRTSTDATEVDGGDTLTAGGTPVVSQRFPVDSSRPDQATLRALDPTQTLNAGATRSFEFNKFRNGGQPVDMRGATVEIRVELSDGQQTDIELTDSGNGGGGNPGNGGQ